MSAAPAPEKLPQIILVFGSDPYFVNLRAEELIPEILPNFQKGDFGLETVDAQVERVDDAVEVLRKAMDALISVSFFATEKIVWLRNLSFCGTDRTSSSETVKAKLDLFRNHLRQNGIPSGVTLLISSCSLAKTSGFYKTLQALAKEGKAKIEETGGGDSAGAQRLLSRILKSSGRTMSAEAMHAFLDRVGTDGATLCNECDKLFAYTAGKEPTAEDIAQICTFRADGQAWDLADAFGMRNLPNAIRALHTLLNMKTAPMYLISVLEGRLNEIAIIADARERGLLAANGANWSPALSPEDNEAVRALGPSDPLAKPPFIKSRVIAQATRWTRAQALHARLAIMKGHENLVSVSVDPNTLLEVTIAAALAD